MPRSGPTTLSLPAFTGATRRLILANLAAFFGLAVLGLIFPNFTGTLYLHLTLTPALLFRGELWQLVTYAFLPLGLLGTLFAMLSLWFAGSMLESTYGARWLYELYFTSTIGGALLASLLTYTHLLGLSPAVRAAGPYAGVFGLFIAIALFFGDLEFLLFFLVRIKARYMVAIYILIYVAMLLTGNGRFDALVILSGTFAGFLYLRLAPRRGLAFALTERYFALRNEYYRSKRRHAARKFEVYMRGQNREVHFDKDGRYVDPDQQQPKSPPRDPNDRTWMN